MVKKPKRKRPARKKEKDWGEDFGKYMEERTKEFAEEVEALGKKFGKHWEKKGKKWEREWEGWWFTTFGVIGPLIKSIIGVIFLAIVVLLLNWINLYFWSGFISRITSFVFTNLHWFFALFLFSNYNDYLSKKYPKTYWIISPITISIGISIFIWIAAWMLNIINIYTGSSVIATISNFLYVNMWGIFVLFLVLGYAFVLIKILIVKTWKVGMTKTKRLYRSGKNKVLGGVCGGLGEYFDVDPIIIRLVWILLVLGFGIGILAYIIAWIIIPRNPKHKW